MKILFIVLFSLCFFSGSIEAKEKAIKLKACGFSNIALVDEVSLQDEEIRLDFIKN